MVFKKTVDVETLGKQWKVRKFSIKSDKRNIEEQSTFLRQYLRSEHIPPQLCYVWGP